MKPYFILPALFILLTPLHAVCPPEGFTPLFNGKNLSGWHGDNPHVTNEAKDRQGALATQAVEFTRSWTVDNGELVNNGKGPYATTDLAYGDFELILDYKISPGADSGIYLRGNPQVQIWDTTEAGGLWKHGAAKGSGGLWNNPKGKPGQIPLVCADRLPGEWNQMRIRLLGSRTWVWLNDQLVVDGVIFANYWSKGKTPVTARGAIHLQTHGGETRWRHIFIREISPGEANQLLGELDHEGFESIFNGHDFAGWQGSLEQYEIVDSSIISLAGGNLYTERLYKDFIFKLEFKLPPEGNNGLAIRYPGDGIPAYTGMCELQVLDNTASRYAELDPRQYHGSAYGKAAAARGYLRPVNTWNTQVVRVHGRIIQVELNGTPILDADLSAITEFMTSKFTSNIPEEGYLGFAGHGKGVAFRNLWIREE